MTLQTFALLLLGLIPAIAVVYGLAAGVVHARGCRYSRTGQPAGYWGTIGLYIVWSIVMWILAVVVSA